MKLSETERRYVLASPMMEPGMACFIAYTASRRAGNFETGHAFAKFAKRHPELFQRLAGSNGCFQYRLTPLGLAVRDYLKGHPNG